MNYKNCRPYEHGEVKRILVVRTISDLHQTDGFQYRILATSVKRITITACFMLSYVGYDMANE